MDLFHTAAEESPLLDGENPNTSDPEDTVLWVNVYTELLDLTTKLLADMDAELGRMGKAYRAAMSDLTTIEAKQRRYHRRLAYWEARARELNQRIVQLSNKHG